MGEFLFIGCWDMAFTKFSGDLGSLPAVTLSFDLLIQNQISTSMNPITAMTKIGWNSLDWFLRYGVHSFRDAQTRAFTDGQTWIQNVSGTGFQRCWGIRSHKTVIFHQKCICENPSEPIWCKIWMGCVADESRLQCFKMRFSAVANLHRGSTFIDFCMMRCLWRRSQIQGCIPFGICTYLCIRKVLMRNCGWNWPQACNSIWSLPDPTSASALTNWIF